MDVIGESVRGTARHRYDEFVDGWNRGERHLPYTVFAVTLILALGAIIVPMTLNATKVEALPKDELLAQRYVEAIAKVPGATEPLPTTGDAIRTFGVDGGEACSTAIPVLHRGLATRAPGGRRTAVRPVDVQRLRVAMRVYCPARDERYGAWLSARTTA